MNVFVIRTETQVVPSISNQTTPRLILSKGIGSREEVNKLLDSILKMRFFDNYIEGRTIHSFGKSMRRVVF